ncbi:MAG: AI-2E family transporter [Blautia sp.]|nr:AI-2E family transporter [Blautia sp.]
MKFSWNDEKKHITVGVTAFLVIAASMILYIILFHGGGVKQNLRHVTSVLAPLIYGLAIAFLLNPMVRFLEEQVVGTVLFKLRLNPARKWKTLIRWICAVASLFLFLVVIFALLAMIVPELITSIMSLITNIPVYAENITKFLQKEVESGTWINEDMVETFNEYYTKLWDYVSTNVVPQFQDMVRNITSGVVDLVNFFKNFIVGSLISLYVMAGIEKYVAKAKQLVYAVIPLKWADILIRSARYTGKTFGGFISGKLVDSIIIGAICYVGCTFLEMPYTLLVSVVIGATNVIPFFGPFLGALPCTLLILIVDPIKSIYFVIFILILQQFDGNILGPKILGDSTGLSSLMVIVAIIIGGGFFGWFGMLVGVPAFAVGSTAIEYLMKRSLGIRNYPLEEEAYYEIDRLDPVDHKPIPLDPDTARGVEPLREPPKRKSLFSRVFMFFWNIITGFVITTIKFIFGLIVMVFNDIRERIHQYKKNHPKINKPGKLTLRQRLADRRRRIREKYSRNSDE